MNDLKTELVDTIVQLARTRSVRQSQLRELRFLQGQNMESIDLKRKLDESKVFIRELQAKRKELRMMLLQSRARKNLRSEIG